jgi:hypothetical protein
MLANVRRRHDPHTGANLGQKSAGLLPARAEEFVQELNREPRNEPAHRIKALQLLYQAETAAWLTILASIGRCE